MINKVTLNGVEVPGIIRDTFHYRAQKGATGAFRMGGVYGSYIEFDYFTPSTVPLSKGDKIRYYQTVDVDEYFAPITPARDVYTNTFTIAEVSDNKKSTHIVAYDSTIQLNIDYSKRLKSLESSFPMSVISLMNDAATEAGVTLWFSGSADTSWAANIGIGYFFADGITVRDILNYGAEFLGGIGYCVSDGQIRFSGIAAQAQKQGWLAPDQYIIAPDDGDYSSGGRFNYNVWYKGNGLTYGTPPTAYDAVRIISSSGQILGEYENTSPPTKYYYVTGNLLIDNIDSLGAYTYNDLASFVYGRLYNIIGNDIGNYAPTKVKIFPFRMPFRVGGIVYIVVNGVRKQFPIMSIDWSDSEVVLESYGRDYTETGYGTSYGGVEEDQTLLTAQVNQLFTTVNELAQRRITELWNNSDTTSSFSAQTVLLSESMSNFDYLLVSYAFSTSSQDFATQLIPVSEIYDNAREFSLRINAATYNRTGARNLTATSDTEIKFFAASYNTNTANGYVIPANIYGIKL